MQAELAAQETLVMVGSGEVLDGVGRIPANYLLGLAPVKVKTNSPLKGRVSRLNKPRSLLLDLGNSTFLLEDTSCQQIVPCACLVTVQKQSTLPILLFISAAPTCLLISI